MKKYKIRYGQGRSKEKMEKNEAAAAFCVIGMIVVIAAALIVKG